MPITNKSKFICRNVMGFKVYYDIKTSSGRNIYVFMSLHFHFKKLQTHHYLLGKGLVIVIPKNAEEFSFEHQVEQTVLEL